MGKRCEPAVYIVEPVVDPIIYQIRRLTGLDLENLCQERSLPIGEIDDRVLATDPFSHRRERPEKLQSRNRMQRGSGVHDSIGVQRPVDVERNSPDSHLSLYGLSVANRQMPNCIIKNRVERRWLPQN